MRNCEIGEAYYTAMAQKDSETMGKYLAADVLLISPLDSIQGKERVLQAAEDFFNFLSELRIKTCVGGEEHVMLALELDCLRGIGLLRTAILLTFSSGKISRIELYYDSAKMGRVKDEVFSS